jgi:hypothetical protein
MTAPENKEAAESASAKAPAALPIVVKFANVTKSFGRGPAAQIAIKDVSFAVEDLPDTGELISIVGPSGCGKSTLLRMIAGLEPHFPQTEGSIEVLGRSDNLLPSSERGLVDQKYSLFPHLTVRQNVMFGLDIRGESRSTRGDKADIWIKKVGLEGCEDKYPQELSGGMQQRGHCRHPGAGATHTFDGRTVWRARSENPLEDAGTAGATLERAAVHRFYRDPFGRGSYLSRRPRVSHGSKAGPADGDFAGATARHATRGNAAKKMVR